jgi:tetratricopeptide (TPR) repeat protein
VKTIKSEVIALMVAVGFLCFSGIVFAAPAEKKDANVGKPETMEKKESTAAKSALPQVDAEWLKRNQALVGLLNEKKYDEALQNATSMLDYLRERKLLEGQEAATTYNSLGVIYLVKGQFDKANVNMLKSLEIATKVYGNNHIEVAKILSNLSQLHFTIGQFFKSKSEAISKKDEPAKQAVEKKETEKKDVGDVNKPAVKKTKKK